MRVKVSKKFLAAIIAALLSFAGLSELSPVLTPVLSNAACEASDCVNDG